MTKRPTTEAPQLTGFDRELLLSVLKHHLTPELRRVVMHAVPHAYNAWMGHTVMATERVSDLDAERVAAEGWKLAAERWEEVATKLAD